MSQLIWILVIIVALVVEAISMGLTSVWFAAAGVITLLLSFFINNIYVELGIFIVLSALMLYFLYPWLRDKVKKTSIKTNVDAMAGKIGIVTEDINNLQAKGQVKVSGQIWTARTDDDDVHLHVGQEVEVIEVQGVKAIVREFKEVE